MGEIRPDDFEPYEYESAKPTIDTTVPLERKREPIKRIDPKTLPRWNMKPMPKRDNPPPSTTPEIWQRGNDHDGNDAA